MEKRYWLRISGMDWVEVTKAKYIGAEKSAGFHSKFGPNEIATAGFGNGTINGSVTYDGNPPLKEY